MAKAAVRKECCAEISLAAFGGLEVDRKVVTKGLSDCDGDALLVFVDSPVHVQMSACKASQRSAFVSE